MLPKSPPKQRLTAKQIRIQTLQRRINRHRKVNKHKKVSKRRKQSQIRRTAKGALPEKGEKVAPNPKHSRSRRKSLVKIGRTAPPKMLN